MKIRSNDRERIIIDAIKQNAPDHWSEEGIEDLVQRFRSLYKLTDSHETEGELNEK